MIRGKAENKIKYKWKSCYIYAFSPNKNYLLPVTPSITDSSLALFSVCLSQLWKNSYGILFLTEQ